MMCLRYFIIFSLSGLFCGCVTVSHEKATNFSSVNQELRLKMQYLERSIYAYTQDKTVFDVAFDDLNKDGHADAIVLLSGINWCGSGGCTLLIFQGRADHQFKFVSKTTVVDTPIYSTEYMHNGWKQLSVYVRKHGQVILSFDGQAYAENPSLLPIQTLELTPENAQLLLEQ